MPAAKMINGLEPRATWMEPPLTLSVPALMVSGPVKVEEAPMMRVPGPVLVYPPVLLMTPDKVSSVAALVTSMVGPGRAGVAQRRAITDVDGHGGSVAQASRGRGGDAAETEHAALDVDDARHVVGA